MNDGGVEASIVKASDANNTSTVQRQLAPARIPCKGSITAFSTAIQRMSARFLIRMYIQMPLVE